MRVKASHSSHSHKKASNKHDEHHDGYSRVHAHVKKKSHKHHEHEEHEHKMHHHKKAVSKKAHHHKTAKRGK